MRDDFAVHPIAERAQERRSTAADAAIIKGMVARGDNQHDVAHYFGTNNGRVNEVWKGTRYPNVEAAPPEDLPVPGPQPGRYGYPIDTVDWKGKYQELQRQLQEPPPMSDQSIQLATGQTARLEGGAVHVVAPKREVLHHYAMTLSHPASKGMPTTARAASYDLLMPFLKQLEALGYVLVTVNRIDGAAPR